MTRSGERRTELRHESTLSLRPPALLCETSSPGRQPGSPIRSSCLGACRRKRKARVTGAVGPDARRRAEGDAGPSLRRDNAADGPTPPVTRRAQGGCRVHAALLVGDDAPHRLPPRALPAPGKPPARGPSHFSDRLLGTSGSSCLPGLARVHVHDYVHDHVATCPPDSFTGSHGFADLDCTGPADPSQGELLPPG